MDRIPIYLVGLLVALAHMPLNIYDVHARNLGTLHTEPWRSKASAAVQRGASAVRDVWLSLWRHRQLVTAAAVIGVLLLAPDTLRAHGVLCVGIVNVTQLEANLKAKKAEGVALLEATMRAANDTVVTAATATTPEVKGRVMTAEEKGAIQLKLDEAKAIKDQIDAARGDANFAAAFEGLTAGMTAGGSHTAPRRVVRSLGAQLVADEAYRAWVKGRGHHRNGTWSSPQVELLDLRAATLTTDDASGGDLIVAHELPGFIPILTKRLVVADLIAPGTTDSPLIGFVKELLFTNAAAPVAEGGAKPESSLTFERASATVKKIAHWMAVTREMLDDYAQTVSVVDARLRSGLDVAEESQLLNGDGTGDNQLGLMNLPGLSAAIARGADSTADAIFKQITAIAVATFTTPDAFVINPTNWMTVQLTKNAAGNYMGSGPWAPAQPATLWGLPGAVTPSIVLGTSLVGAYRTAAQFFRKGGVLVEATNSHADFFIKNLVAILAEERGALVVYREAAFGKVTGLN